MRKKRTGGTFYGKEEEDNERTLIQSQKPEGRRRLMWRLFPTEMLNEGLRSRMERGGGKDSSAWGRKELKRRGEPETAISRGENQREMWIRSAMREMNANKRKPQKVGGGRVGELSWNSTIERVSTNIREIKEQTVYEHATRTSKGKYISTGTRIVSRVRPYGGSTSDKEKRKIPGGSSGKIPYRGYTPRASDGLSPKKERSRGDIPR